MYSKNLYVKELVAFETSKQYFREQRDRLDACFIEFQKDGKTFFHVSEPCIRTAIKNAKEGKKL